MQLRQEMRCALVIWATRHPAARLPEPRRKPSAASVRLDTVERVLAARAAALHAQQVRATRWALAMALAQHVMRTPARAHAQRRHLAHAVRATEAPIAA